MNRKPVEPGFAVLRRNAEGDWQLLGEVRRTPGLTAQAARTKAIREATQGKARAGEGYAAVPLSEWRVAQQWTDDDDRPSQPACR